jgi:hypothetical protein
MKEYVEAVLTGLPVMKYKVTLLGNGTSMNIISPSSCLVVVLIL